MLARAISIVVLSLAPLPAAAQACGDGSAASVDEAVAAYEEADFERAYALFDQLILGTQLSRSDLVRVYATRALLRFADGDSEGMLRDLTALASLEPAYELGPRAPPPVHEAFDRLRGAALDLEVVIEPLAVGARVSARVIGDRADIVRAVVVGVRVPGGRFRESTDGTISIAEASGELEYYARVVGPGGATLAVRGERDAPQLERFAPRSSDDTLAIVLGTSGAALAIGAGVLLAVLFTSAGPTTNEVIGPRFEIPLP